jgi:hypothetical protein
MNKVEREQPTSAEPAWSESMKTVRCSQCGGQHFYVGQIPYETNVKCVSCGWEECVHDG